MSLADQIRLQTKEHPVPNLRSQSIEYWYEVKHVKVKHKPILLPKTNEEVCYSFLLLSLLKRKSLMSSEIRISPLQGLRAPVDFSSPRNEKKPELKLTKAV